MINNLRCLYDSPKNKLVIKIYKITLLQLRIEQFIRIEILKGW
jgi:hypothetical protein